MTELNDAGLVRMTFEGNRTAYAELIRVITNADVDIDEEHTIEGLTGFARETDRYPTSLACEQLSREMWKLLGRKVLSAFIPPRSTACGRRADIKASSCRKNAT